ncbi:MAG: metal-sulfur cluster assembly factor [Candidatus Micrarchaeia archaeon]
MVTVKDVVDALSQCIDPEIGADVVSIGLIQDIKVDKDNNVKVKLTMTSPMCPIMSTILATIDIKLESLPSVGKVELELSWDPMWTPEMMSDELKLKYNQPV